MSWLRRDYTDWWRLPPPLPPARWPVALMVLIAALIVLAIGLGI